MQIRIFIKLHVSSVEYYNKYYTFDILYIFAI